MRTKHHTEVIQITERGEGGGRATKRKGGRGVG